MGVLDLFKKTFNNDPEKHEVSSREYSNWNDVPDNRFEDWVFNM